MRRNFKYVREKGLFKENEINNRKRKALERECFKKINNMRKRNK